MVEALNALLRGQGRHEMTAQLVAGDGIFRFSNPGPGRQFANSDLANAGLDKPELHVLRASGLAQARLQLAVLSGNRRRALEQIDRLVGFDRQLERLARAGQVLDLADLVKLQADLADQRLAIASEKLALTSEIRMPRLEPAFGAGMTELASRVEDVKVVEGEAVSGRLVRLMLWGLALIVLSAAIAVAVGAWL
jgi:hypothetical protein